MTTKSFSKFFGAGLIAILKSTKLAAAFKLLSFGKPLLVVASMLFSALVYGIWLGPWFGVGLVAMLFLHEMGHIIALRLKGYDTPGPLFIPFLGAVIFAPAFKNRDTEAFVGYGGPLLGTAAALGCFGLWYALGASSPILLIVSYIGLFLNVFNLIPISPLDGGRITQAVGLWFKYLGAVLLLAYSLWSRQPAILLIWILCIDVFRLPLWFKPGIAGFCGGAMIGFMALGYGSQPWYINVLDGVMASAFVAVYYLVDRKKAKNRRVLLRMINVATTHNLSFTPPSIEDEVFPDDRPGLSVPMRSKWLAYYLGLLVVGGLGMAAQIAVMPSVITGH